LNRQIETVPEDYFDQEIIDQQERSADKRTKIENQQPATPENFQQETTRSFINVMVIETIPILLIFYGFIQMEAWFGAPNQIPFILTITILLFGVVNVLLSRWRILSSHKINDFCYYLFICVSDTLSDKKYGYYSG
jgi:hypothetical protein